MARVSHKMGSYPFFLAVVVAASAGVTAFGQTRRGAAACDDQSFGSRGWACETRDATIAGGGVNPIEIDASPNGGVKIHGWDRPDVAVHVRITAEADTDAEAKRLVSGVRLVTAGGAIHAEGPETRGRDASWSASFDVQLPRTAMVTLTTRNGGIGIEDFQGTAQFHTTNGGVSLSRVSGDIRGETKNGGVTVDLTGDRWDGAGLDVTTTNGGIRMTLPQQYSASLDTRTSHGRISIDFPVTVNGRIRGELKTTLGAGGATLRAVTTNGGVSIRSRSN